jgi:fluoride ion exporter CrcB/FEX
MSGDDLLPPELDGRGGGFGKFTGMTVRELSGLFDRVSADSTMRSVSAVLRIAREQLEARWHMGNLRIMAIFCGFVAIGFSIAYPLVPQTVKVSILKGILGGFTAFICFGVATLSTHRATNAAIAQERAIRDLAVDALARIVEEPGFKAKPLDADQRRILADLLKTTKRNEPKLAALLLN